MGHLCPVTARGKGCRSSCCFGNADMWYVDGGIDEYMHVDECV